MTARARPDGIEVVVIDGAIHLRYWSGGELLAVAWMGSDPARAISLQLEACAAQIDGLAAGRAVH